MNSQREEACQFFFTLRSILELKKRVLDIAFRLSALSLPAKRGAWSVNLRSRLSILRLVVKTDFFKFS